MSDDLNKKGEPDRSLINMNEPHEVSYWTKKFNVSKEELERAIEKAGNRSAEEVERRLK